MKFPKKLQYKLDQRKANQSIRILGDRNQLVDFSSNDYLGIARSEELFHRAHDLLVSKDVINNGATGSRLLTGNFELYEELEGFLSDFHNGEALVFNSGYDANLGFFGSVPQRNDIVLYDEYVHASIRDGMQLSNARSYAFKHNDLDDLEQKLIRYSKAEQTIYIVTESIFSMDGDEPDLKSLAAICQKYEVYLVVDEAHALGIFGKGLVQELQLESLVFARIITFGKALGCHGAAIIGGLDLKKYLINFARSFIYTTGLTPHTIATVLIAYKLLEEPKPFSERLASNISYFIKKYKDLQLDGLFIKSRSAIQSCVISGNEKVKQIAFQLKEKGFDVKPILSPTVPEGMERLRFCLHEYNTEEEIDGVLDLLQNLINNER